MKKTIYMLLVLILLSTAMRAQTLADPDKIWISPAAYAMDEEITWYFDMSSADIPDDFPLALWIWGPASPPHQEVGEPTPLTYLGDKIWSLTMTPTTFFNKTADQLLNNGDSNYWFLLRNMDGSRLTGTLSYLKVDYVGDFAKSGKVFDYKPTDFKLGSTLSILFNSNAVDGFGPVPYTLHMHSGLNDWDENASQSFDAWDAAVRAKTQFKDMGNGIYKKDLVPETYYGVSSEYNMENLVFIAVKWNGDVDWGGNTPTYKILTEAEEVVTPVFSIFPQKVSFNDILIISRQNNDRNQRISYTLTGGGKVITGELSGDKPMTLQRTFIYIAKEFKDMDISKVSLLVKDQYDTEIYKGDIPLVKVDNLK